MMVDIHCFVIHNSNGVTDFGWIFFIPIFLSVSTKVTARGLLFWLGHFPLTWVFGQFVVICWFELGHIIYAINDLGVLRNADAHTHTIHSDKMVISFITVTLVLFLVLYFNFNQTVTASSL